MKQIEFGDFQTPLELAKISLSLLSSKPDIIIEPTCGKGTFLKASQERWNSSKLIGIEINSSYVNEARSVLDTKNAKIIESDVFSFDWPKTLKNLKGSVMFVGNPPWVTNSKQGQISGDNLPLKSNFQSFSGLAAVTGKSNFDISEFILMNLITTANEHLKVSEFAFLIKTSVARKLLVFMNDKKIGFDSCRMFHIDSKKWFSVSVDACLFTFRVGKQFAPSPDCDVFQNLNLDSYSKTIGYYEKHLIADVKGYKKSKKLYGTNFQKWRSGIKHDCTKVLELALAENGDLLNGANEVVKIEDTFLYPFYKSSDLPKDNKPRKYLITPQKYVGENTAVIKAVAPKTWRYLSKNQEQFNNRKSIIYKKGPDFCIFGVGDYSYKPYKVAVSGLLKEVKFRLIGPFDDKPVLFDDTCYFLSFDSLKEAKACFDAVNSPAYKIALQSLVFTDSKRPITAETLNKIEIQQIEPSLAVRKRSQLNFETEVEV